MMDELRKTLKEMIGQCDWIGIYNKFKPFDLLLNNKEVWNNSEILNQISLALAKLSETSGNLKYSFNTEKELNDFLHQQKTYREATILLRRRCIELTPDNAAYYSTLAYSHYQFLRELIQPGGRRDGRALDEVGQALTYLNKAIELSPTRISDYYRKGQILSELLPKLLVFNRKTLSNRDKLTEASRQSKEKIKEGILAFKEGIDCYESIQKENKFDLRRYYKDYIKSLYDISRAYFDLIQNNWDEIQFALKLNHAIPPHDSITYIPEDYENIKNAICNIEKCLKLDNIPALSNSSIKENIDLACYTGHVEGVYKLYSLGKYFFTKGWIVSGYGQRLNQESNMCFDLSEKLYFEALKFPWSENKVKQNKIYIAEKIARLFITQGKYEEATAILEKHIDKRKKTDYYVFYTLAIAYMNNNEFDKAKACINSALNDKFGNKELWLGHFLLSCNNLRNGDIDKAKNALGIASKIAKDSGKENLDSLLIAQGFIAYKENKKRDALVFLEEAQKLNPYRLFVNKRIDKWKNKNLS